MKNKSFFCLIMVFVPFLMCAKEPQLSLVAIKQTGQSQIFNIRDYPCLTIKNENGVPSFNIKDKQNIVASGVITCVFEVTETNDIEVVTNQETSNRIVKKYIKNGTLYIEHNGKLYSVIGQRIK